MFHRNSCSEIVLSYPHFFSPLLLSFLSDKLLDEHAAEITDMPWMVLKLVFPVLFGSNKT